MPEAFLILILTVEPALSHPDLKAWNPFMFKSSAYGFLMFPAFINRQLLTDNRERIPYLFAGQSFVLFIAILKKSIIYARRLSENRKPTAEKWISDHFPSRRLLFSDSLLVYQFSTADRIL